MGGVENFSVTSLNRQSVTRNGNTTGYTPNALNQYKTVGGQTLDYDWNFNLKSFDGATFAYNAQNQLVSASKGGKTVQFLYDGLGRCVRRTVNGVATSIAYDGWKPVVERDLSGNTKAVNIYGAGPDEILWRSVPGLGDFRYYDDARSSVMFAELSMCRRVELRTAWPRTENRNDSWKKTSAFTFSRCRPRWSGFV